MAPPGSGPTSDGGRVAAGHPDVARAAAEVLGLGGNAYDATVAAGFAASVAEPALTSPAGGGFLLARTAAGTETLFDFFVDTPGLGRTHRPVPHFDEVAVTFEAAVQVFHCGPGSIAVPGCLTGWLHIHRRLGRLPLRDVVEPAVRLATDGVQLLAAQAGIIALLEPILTRTPETRALFAPEGRLLTAGDTFHNPQLANFLVSLGAGEDLRFSGGDLARATLAVAGAEGGLVTAEDLAAHRVVERVPLRTRFRDRTVLANPAPSFGGTLVAAALALLDGADLAPRDPCWTAATVTAAADVDRRRTDLLTAAGVEGPTVSRGTTHVSVVDAEGNVAAMTTSNGECSGDVIPGTGILCNNVLGEDDLHPEGFHAAAPGRRVASMMSPTVVVDDRGVTDLVVGSGGSKRIRAAITQVLVNVLVHGMDAQAAVDAPRAHWDGDHTEIEPGLDDAAVAALEALGPVAPWSTRSVYFGGAHAVTPGRGAGGDPRRDGATAHVPLREPPDRPSAGTA